MFLGIKIVIDVMGQSGITMFVETAVIIFQVGVDVFRYQNSH